MQTTDKELNMAVPKAMQGKYDEIAAVLEPYCEKYLNEEYRDLCLRILEKLCRKRPSPLNSGRANTWAAGIVYAAGSANFIFDKSQDVHMTAEELAAPFGLSKSTASAKGRLITDMLKISCTRPEWVLPSMLDANPLVWMVTINGIPLDARALPLPMQLLCVKKHIIPYAPGLREQEQKEKAAKAAAAEKSDPDKDGK